MSSTHVDQVDVQSARLRGLRANSFAAMVILLLEFGLGTWVNLYANLPVSDHGANIATGFGHAVAKGPVGLSIHALLGTLLIISSGTALVRALRIGHAVFIGATVAGLVAIVVAALSGASFVGHQTNAASMSMAIAAAAALFAYTFVLFISGMTARTRA